MEAKPDTVAHMFNFSTWEAEAGGLHVQDQQGTTSWVLGLSKLQNGILSPQ